jgi:nicotinate-nucleotide adenylyltransferase
MSEARAARARTVALFGGSFNPPHLAHQMACLVVLETEAVDQLWMVPTYRHAFGKPLAPFDDRVAMCRLATAPFGARVEVCTIERELPGEESRTFRTVSALCERFPALAFRLVVGADILAERSSWYRWDDLCALAPLIVVGRSGAAGSPDGGVELPAISSTEVRARVARGESAVPLVPRSVMDYIDQRGLYR